MLRKNSDVGGSSEFDSVAPRFGAARTRIGRSPAPLDRSLAQDARSPRIDPPPTLAPAAHRMLLRRSFPLILLATAAGSGTGTAASAAAIRSAPGLGKWFAGEGYGLLVERGPLGGPMTTREIVLIHAIRSEGHVPDLLVLLNSPVGGGTTGAYRLEIGIGSQQPVAVEPQAVRFDARAAAFAIQSDGDRLRCSAPAGADHFQLVTVPSASGPVWLPYWVPAMVGIEPRDLARGTWHDFSRRKAEARPVRQWWHRDAQGSFVVSLRADDGGPMLVASARFDSTLPLPLWGQVLDAARGEHVRFRLVLHAENLGRALALGRGAVAGDALLFPPETLLEAESVWRAGVRDLVADDVISDWVRERRLRRLSPRRSPSIGEVVPFAYELFAVAPPVSTGTSAAPAAPSGSRSTVSPRGAVGLFYAGRFERPDTGIRYEAWVIPGSDERSNESEAPNPVTESTGRMLVRWILGRATSGLLADRGFSLYVRPGTHARSRAIAASSKTAAPAANAARPPRGSDAILIRREVDLAPVALFFYRLADDLRTPIVFSRIDLEAPGSVSAVRRSLLERPKDFFLAGGFTAFTTKPGSSLLLTRSADEGTVVETLDDRGCTLDLLTERDLPEEPWTIAFDLGGKRKKLWGTPTALAFGRSRFGDTRMPRNGVLRRTDSEELVAYEDWEADASWWTFAFAAYPKQGFGVRFRPLVHVPPPELSGDGNGSPGDVLPFAPPQPPPQPKANPKTAQPSKPPKNTPKPKPDPKPAPPKPPVPTGGPTTGPGSGG